MARRPKNPSDDYQVGYEVGWAGRARQRDAEREIEVNKLSGELRLLRARLNQAVERAEDAEKNLAITERKLEAAYAKLERAKGAK